MKKRFEIGDRLVMQPFAPSVAPVAKRLINAYVRGWPWSRPVDAELMDRWKTLKTFYQPEHMWLVERGGVPRVWLHGERGGKNHHYIHLLAMKNGAAAEAAWALRQVEEQCRREGVERLFGPTFRAGNFYGGYVCALEPYHPHWAAEGTEAYVRAGFKITHPAVIMVAELDRAVALDDTPPGYRVIEGRATPEFKARAFLFLAQHKGEEAASAAGRLYPFLKTARGGAVGQIGFVGTHAAHRGRGLARILVQHCLQRLRAWGAGEVLIATGLENAPALRAYERAGFERRHSINEWSKDLKSAAETTKSGSETKR